MAPVRLKVSYKSPEALLGELTRSVGRGGVRIESHRALPVGTRFVFELKSAELHQSVEVQGTVMSVSDSGRGTWVLHIRYEPPQTREGLEAVLSRIFMVGRADAKRKHPRIPLQVRAVGETPESPTFRLRDISLGGVGLDIESETVPDQIKVGTPFLMMMKLTSGHLGLHGEVAWVVTSKSDGLPLRVGVRFGKMAKKTEALLTEVVSLRSLPAPPWIARVVFGAEAVKQMPAIED